MKQYLSATLLIALVATISSAAEATPKEIPESAKALIGCWQHEADANALLNFEPTRCIVSDGGQLSVFGAVYGNGSFKLSLMGQKIEANYEVKDGVLSVTRDNETKRYKKLDKIPDEVQLKPLAIGLPSSIAPTKLKEIQDELAKRVKTDQAVRTDPARQNEMQKVDAENTDYVTKLVKEFGWIGASRFGQEASNTAFLIVQHSGKLPLMLAALPEIEKDLKAKKLADGQAYALLYDRVQIYTGQKQRYGTQIGSTADGSPCVFPLEDRANVDKLRKELGMMSLTQYLSFFEQRSGKKVTFSEE
jgi:hypothetical protein